MLLPPGTTFSRAATTVWATPEWFFRLKWWERTIDEKPFDDFGKRVDFSKWGPESGFKLFVSWLTNETLTVDHQSEVIQQPPQMQFILSHLDHLSQSWSSSFISWPVFFSEWLKTFIQLLKSSPRILPFVQHDSRKTTWSTLTCLHHSFVLLRLFFFMLYCFELISDWRACSFVVSILVFLGLDQLVHCEGNPAASWLVLVDGFMASFGPCWRQWVEIHVEVNEKLQRCRRFAKGLVWKNLHQLIRQQKYIL